MGLEVPLVGLLPVTSEDSVAPLGSLFPTFFVGVLCPCFARQPAFGESHCFPFMYTFPIFYHIVCELQ